MPFIRPGFTIFKTLTTKLLSTQDYTKLPEFKTELAIAQLLMKNRSKFQIKTIGMEVDAMKKADRKRKSDKNDMIREVVSKKHRVESQRIVIMDPEIEMAFMHESTPTVQHLPLRIILQSV